MNRSFLRRAFASDVTRISGVLLAIVAISLLHSTTNRSEVIWHGLLLRLSYIPILVAAYWYGPDEGLSLENVERDLLLAALEKHGWNQTKAAAYLDITRSALLYRVQKFRLERPNPELREPQTPAIR